MWMCVYEYVFGLGFWFYVCGIFLFGFVFLWIVLVFCVLKLNLKRDLESIQTDLQEINTNCIQITD